MNPHKRSVLGRRGNVLIWVAIALPVIAGFAALAVDAAALRLMHAKLQATADAAASAGAPYLPDAGNVRTVAQEYAVKNMSLAKHGTVLADSDIVFGSWDGVTNTFTAGGSPRNAVKVTTRRAQANGNPVQLFFARVLGFNESDVSAVAIAIRTGGSECFEEGIIAGNQVIVGEDPTVPNYCIYGRNGVSLGQNAAIWEDSRIGALDLAMIEFGQDSHVVPTGEPLSEHNVLAAMDMQPTLALIVMQIIDDLQIGAYRPPQITEVVYMGLATHLPETVQSGTAYIFEESVSIDQVYELQDVIIATRKNISFGQDAGIINTGDPTSGAVAIGLLAGENIAIGQNSVVIGADIVSGGDVVIGQDLVEFRGTIQAVKNITLGQDPFPSGFGGSLPGFGSAGQVGSGGSELAW